MLFALAGLLLTVYVPGALIFRVPIFERHRRSALSAEERAYWAVILSIAWTSMVAFSMAWLARYTIGRLLLVNAALSLAILVAWRGRLRFADAPRPGLPALVPVALVVLAGYTSFPPAEYVLGGKDPGVYVNEGIQIGQRGSLTIHDEVAARVPEASRELFFPYHGRSAYYSTRFMGFFLVDPGSGRVTGQFPQLYPMWIAIGYGLYGLTGGLLVLGCAAMLGALGYYFLIARLAGRTAAGAGAAMLAISVIQVWFARYPNAEMFAQPLVAAGPLAFARSHVDDDAFFAPVAGLVLGLLLFARIDALLIVGAVLAAVLLLRVEGRRLDAAFLMPLGVTGLLAFAYLVTMLAPYAALPLAVVTHPAWTHVAIFGGAALAVLAIFLLAGVPAAAALVRRHLPRVLALGIVIAAAYAFWLRVPGGRLAAHDAQSFRMFAWYVHPAGLAAGVMGFALLCWQRFWRDPAFLLAAAVYSLFVFYKVQIVPEHFWMARRFVMIVNPAVLLCAAALILAGIGGGAGGPVIRNRTAAAAGRIARIAIRVAVVVLLSLSLARGTSLILHHVEYEGFIPRLEKLASRFGDRDLVLVESRNASDLHVLALPLAYIYARNVLVLNTPKPDKARLAAFLEDARTKYKDVYFVGGGGTDLLSKRIAVESVASERFQIPEYESLRNAYPTRVRHKEFDYGIYRFVNRPAAAGWFSLDVGARDDLHVIRFNAKERDAERTFRWTQDVSYVSVTAMPADARELTIWMANGGRPETLPPCTVEVFLNDQRLGQVTVGPEERPYSFGIPRELADAAARSDEAALLKLVSSTWNPRAALGIDDNRELGAIVDRVDVR
jgi:hypothetical protein